MSSSYKLSDNQFLVNDIQNPTSTDALLEHNEVVIVKYLTPYKIAVAILSLLYLGGIIPPKDTPQVMGYVIDFLDTNVNQSDEYKTQIILDEGNLHTLKTIVDVVKIPTAHGTQSIFDYLMDVLFSMSSIDELSTLMTRLPSFVIKADGKHDDEDEKITQEALLLGIKPVKQSSILGAFFMRCFLSFDCLAFDQVMSLFDCLDYFRTPFRARYESRKQQGLLQVSPVNLDVFFGPNYIPADSDSLGILQSLLPHPNPSYCLSSETLESVLQSKMVGLSKNNAVSLDEINKILNFLSENNKPLPVFAHYIKYYCALQERDYELSFEHLHRYFDYTMHYHGRAQYHNALFTLATLHAEFESFDEAMCAVSEAISVARENKDTPALTDIHFWLYSFLILHPECQLPENISSKEQLLQFLKVKSQNTSYSLYSLALQQDALYQLSHCGSLTQALESLFKSSFISVISNSVSSAVGFCLMESVMWERIGVSAMSQLYNNVSLDLSRKESNKWLLIQYTVQRANLLFDSGDIAEVFKLMESVKPAASESQVSYRRWYWNYMLLKLRHRINECKLDEAGFILERLKPLINLDFRPKMMYNIHKILLKSKIGMNAEAKSLAWDLIETITKSDTDIWYQIMLMKTYIDLVIETEGRPANAMTIVLRLIGLADKASISIFKYYGVIYMSKISAEEGHLDDAMVLLDSIMPKVLETNVADLIAFAYKSLSDTVLMFAVKVYESSILFPHASFSASNAGGSEFSSFSSVITNLKNDEEESKKKQIVSRITKIVEKSLGYLSKAGAYYEALQKWESVLEIFKEMAKQAEFVEKVYKQGKTSEKSQDNEEYEESASNSHNSSVDEVMLTIDYKLHSLSSLLINSKENIGRLEELVRQNKRSTYLGMNVIYEEYDMMDDVEPSF